MKEKFLSTNFILNFGLMLAGVFAISADVVTQSVALVGGIIGFVGIARTALKDAKFGGFKKFADPNVYSYAFAALAAVLPIVGDLTPYLGRLIEAAAVKDWGAVGSAVIALAVTIFKLAEKPRAARAADGDADAK
jgi:hypothetical protein